MARFPLLLLNYRDPPIKNPAYGRHQLCRPMLIVAPIPLNMSDIFFFFFLSPLLAIFDFFKGGGFKGDDPNLVSTLLVVLYIL